MRRVSSTLIPRTGNGLKGFFKTVFYLYLYVNRLATMKLLQDYAAPLSKLLKDQRLREGESYRLMHYVVRQPVDDGLRLYNVLTKAVVLLSADEARNMEADPASVPELVSKWFAVPVGHDDRKLVRQVRAIGKAMEKPSKSIKSYTILTTTDCNARCFYCYEKGRSRIPMSDGTAEAAARYIIRNSLDEKVGIRWFGGEPLYNKRVISLICRRLREAGKKYSSTMVSNGFLFDEATVKEAVDDWKLKKVQITLDGTEPVYNKVKNFIYPEENAFKRVLGNIQTLVDAGVRVNIRLNMDRHNADDLFSLADLLGDAFGGNPLVRVYSHSLFEACSPGSAVHHSAIQRKELSDKRKELQDKLDGFGLSEPGKLGKSLKFNRCMADSDSCVIILPDGHIGKCEHFSDSEWFAHVSEEGRDEKVLAAFKELRPELDACAECPVYPDCFRLSKCEEAVHCYPEEREEKLAGIRRQLLFFYGNQGENGLKRSD